MKKLMTTTMLSLVCLSSAMAAPVNPMDGYEYDNISRSTMNYAWNNMTTKVVGDDCYRRAQLWSIGLKNQYGEQIKARKIFMHYTDKFNKVLDGLGGRKISKAWSWTKSTRSLMKKHGLNYDEASLYKNNITWDYHVAPLVEVDGQDLVLDKTLGLPYDVEMPYTGVESVELTQRISTPEEWVEALTFRGEMLWKVRKKLIKAEMNKYRSKARKGKRNAAKKYNALVAEYKSLEMDKKDSIDIKCTEVSSMAEVDAQHETAWCFYSKVPMYYYNEIDLRNLAYGQTKYNHSGAVPVKMNTAENNARGEAFIQNDFNAAELKDAIKELDSESQEKKFKRILERMED